jgi:hypothetical protein
MLDQSRNWPWSTMAHPQFHRLRFLVFSTDRVIIGTPGPGLAMLLYLFALTLRLELLDTPSLNINGRFSCGDGNIGKNTCIKFYEGSQKAPI